MGSSQYKRFLGALVAGSVFFSSTGAIASVSPLPASQPDAWAVLSVMSGGASAAAACGTALTAAAAAVQPAGGCVLPQVDAAAAAGPPPPQPIPVPPVEAPSSGFGIDPLLLGLAAIAAGVGLYLILHKSHSNSPA